MSRRGRVLFGGAVVLFVLCSTASIFGFVALRANVIREDRQKRQQIVDQVRAGPDPAQVTLHRSYGTFVPPANVQVISISKAGKHSYDVTVKGPKQVIVDLLIRHYGLDQPED